MAQKLSTNNVTGVAVSGGTCYLYTNAANELFAALFVSGYILGEDQNILNLAV